MRLLHVVGARPNFMKVAPVWQAVAEAEGFEQALVHTGQHYDVNMSDVFIRDLGLPSPHYYLGAGSGTHAQQTAAIMVAFEQTLADARPAMVLVYGDVNSTVAAALVCAKLLVPVAHVEAGLRSRDRTMPEEINRLLTDQIAALLFTPSPDGDANLLREGVAREKIHLVGNVMIDSLARLLPIARQSSALERLELSPGQYGVVTLHRPVNVDDPTQLRRVLAALAGLAAELPLVFPIHPRTRARIAQMPGAPDLGNLRLVDPLGYLEFLHLLSDARVVLTDSGGIQEETSYLGVPCVTLRTTTERPVTVEQGTNTLVGNDLDALERVYRGILAGAYTWDRRPPGGIPHWDGHAARRIVGVLAAQAQI